MPDALHAALGKRIKERREFSDLTQENLAKQVDISRTSLTNIERGRQRLLVDQLYRIAAALEVNPTELLPAQSDLYAGDRRLVEEPIPASVHRFVEKVRADKK